MEYIVTFHTHFDALQYSRFLKKLDISHKLKPVPRNLSSSCGTCLVFSSDEDLDQRFFDKELEKLFSIEDGNYTLILEKE